MVLQKLKLGKALNENNKENENLRQSANDEGKIYLLKCRKTNR